MNATLNCENIIANMMIHFDQSIRLNQYSDIKILIAEDDQVNQIVLLKMLEKLGYIADIAKNGFEVLEAIKDTSYDLIFMDIHMPEMNGVTATREIRESSDINKQPKIIAVTANAFSNEKIQYLNAGMDDYMSKPFVKDQLSLLLVKHIKDKKVNP